MAEEKLKILLVEDNGIFLNIAEEMLSEHNVKSSKTAKDALKTYDKFKPDITFLDIALPDGNGQDLLNDIKKQNKDAFVVMLTASRLVDDIAESACRGAKGYIMKPFSKKRINECIAQYREYAEKKLK